MRRSGREESGPSMEDKKFKGVRRRKWGKWVSEIRVPGSKERLWLGSYTTPEAAAIAHDVAFYCLHRPFSLDGLNFPQLLPASCANVDMSPKSVQKAASDAGMGIDAQMTANSSLSDDEKELNISGVIQGLEAQFWGDDSYEYGTWEEKELNSSVEDYDYIQ